jgi:hypothetical protein
LADRPKPHVAAQPGHHLYACGVVLRAARRLDAGADERTGGRGSVGAGIDGSGVATGSGADETGKGT